MNLIRGEKRSTGRRRSKGASHRYHPLRAVHARKAFIGRLLIVILALGICTIPVLFINDAISYIPLITFLLIIGISYAYLRLLIKSLIYSEDSLLDSCERGSDIEFVVNFKNRSPLVFLRLEPYFYIGDLFDEVDAIIPATMVLMPFEERDFHFDASFEHIGSYSAGLRKIIISDLLGLFSRTIENPNRHEVNVLPKLFDISRLDLSNVSVQESRKAFQPIVTDDMDYAGVREYVWGDPLKTIHWKLSARTCDGSYFTRLFETFGNPGVSIILDGSAPDYDHESLMQIFDGVVESALSVNYYACQNGIDSELLYLDTQGERSKMRLLGSEKSDALVDDIPRIRVGEGQDTLELLRREGNSIHSQGNIAYCTAHLDEEIISTLIEIKLHQHNPLLFLIIPKYLEGKERDGFLSPLKRLESAGIVYYLVSSAEELARGAA